MQIKNKKLAVGIHLLLWAVILGFNFLMLKSNDVRFEWYNQILKLIIYAAVFYMQYLLIIPLLFKKRYGLYVLFSILLLCSGFSASFLLAKRKHVNRYMQLKEKGVVLPGDEYKPRGRDIYFEGRNRILTEGRKHPFITRFLLYDLLVVIFFLLLSMIIRLLQKWQNDDKLKIILEKEKTNAELYYLKQQINPHFLFNSLNSIYSLSITKADETTDSILKLSSILRYVLYESEKSRVFLKTELEVISDYIELQKLRLTSITELNFEILGDCNTHKIEPLLLIPILENAFKYGVNNDMPSFIVIKILIEDQQLHLQTQNSIVENNYAKESSGIGLSNIERRLDLLYPNNYSLNYQEKDGEFLVNLSLKLKP